MVRQSHRLSLGRITNWMDTGADQVPGVRTKRRPPMRQKRKLSRRIALKLGAGATAGAAGKLSIGFWDHWVPTGNDILRKQIQTWAEKNKVDVQVDFITSV